MDVDARKDARELEFDWVKSFVNPTVRPFLGGLLLERRFNRPG
jgi:hypothetical protein